MLPDATSKVIGRRYLLHDLLGKGGMGHVYHATDRLTGQAVALKQVVTDPSQSSLSSSYIDSDFRLALAQEFKLSASLRHPHIIEVKDYGFDEGQQPYFTMEMLSIPQTLLEAGQDQSLIDQVRLVSQLLQALAYLHRRGVLHRDLKPANVLVVDGEVKVVDFGLSAMRDRARQDAEEGTTAGTLAYMAPEILMGNPASEASDQYAVGMMAFEMLAGHHPFRVADAGSLINQILHTQPALSDLDVSVDLSAAIGRMIHKSPESRFGSVGEAITSLNTAVNGSLSIETAELRESYLQAARLVGRDRELQQLADDLDRAMDGAGSFWLIAGESGVGKSRLVDELRTLALVRGAVVMRGQAVSVGRKPYQMWLMVLRWLCLLSDDMDDLEAGLLKALLPDVDTLLDTSVVGLNLAEIKPETARARLIGILDKTLRQQQQPAVIFFEDLHWAGSESLATLALLTKLVGELPLLVIATYRDDERPDLPQSLPDGIPTLKLNRLSQADIAELSEAMLGEAGRQPQVVGLLQRETEGNVFFLIEVVRALAEEAGQLDLVGKRTLPPQVFAGGVRRIVERRLDRISPVSQAVLQTAAVIGRQIDRDLLQAMYPNMDFEGWLTECANAAVLEVQDGLWQFAHDKLRDGVLVTLSDEQRMKLHRRVGETLERTTQNPLTQAVALAYHWGRAGDLEKEEFYVVSAGLQSLRSGAFREAMTYLEHALHLVSNSNGDEGVIREKNLTLNHNLAQAHLGVGEYAHARRLYLDNLVSCEDVGNQSGMATSLHSLGDVAFVMQDFLEAEGYYSGSLEIAREMADQSLVAKVLNSLGNVAYEQGDDAAAKRLYQESLSLSRQIGDQWGMAGSLSTPDTSAEDTSRYERTKGQLQAILADYEESGDQQKMAESLFELGAVARESSRFEEAKEYFQKSLNLWQILDNPVGAVMTLDQLGAVDTATQTYDEARSYFHQALEIARDIQDIPLALNSLVGLAKLLRVNGSKEQAFELLSFVIYHPECPDDTLDEGERLLYELEGEVAPEVLDSIWGKGKDKDFALVLQDILK